jgi:rifampicin phosphotransferase
MNFEAPGPGFWELDTQHFPTPLSRFMGEYWTEAMEVSSNSTGARYGRKSYLTTALINGYFYKRTRFVGAQPESSEQLTLDNPIVAERVNRSQAAVQEKLWDRDLERWDNEIKPDSIARNVKLGSVDIDALNHDGLNDYLYECRQNHILMVRRHHMFSGTAELTKNLFFLDATRWSGLKVEQLILLLDGSSPISTGFTSEFEAVVLAIKDDPDAIGLLRSGSDAAAKVSELQAAEGPVGDSMSKFILNDGHRLSNSFDLHGQCLFELPETIVDRIDEAIKKGFVDRSPDAREDAEYVRTLVPEEHREAFDKVLATARRVARIKDERGVYDDIWGGGVMRKALLGAGRKLVEDGLLSDPLHLIDASWQEVQQLLRGVSVVSDSELAERCSRRLGLTWQDAPATLGESVDTPEMPEDLPAEVQRLIDANTVMDGSVEYDQSESEDLVGLTSNPGAYEGKARVATGDYSFNQIEPGDVLVTSNHSEAYNAVAGRVGAIVTDTGGILSHLSIVSRELGIPCIVGCKNATVLIPDGAMVRVDGATGKVTVLD